MGMFRLALALLVTGSHIGGMGNTPAGTVGIAGFFTISGFLMAHTIGRNYADGGAWRFYANRAVRIVPPLVAISAVTWLALWLRDGRPFQIHWKDGAPAGAFMPVNLPKSVFAQFTFNFQGFPYFMEPSAQLLPQAWSLVTEGVFYVMAPALVWLFSPGAPRWARWLVPAASLPLAVAAYGSNWLRSPFAALWIFWLGMAGYFHQRDRQTATPLERTLALGAAGAVVATGISVGRISDWNVMFVVPILTVVWLTLGRWHRTRASQVDTWAGQMAYGVFLSHFLSTIAMYWIAEITYDRTGIFGIFGIPDISESRLRYASFAFAIVFGVATYVLFERPFERIRARIRTTAPAPLLPAGVSETVSG